MIFPFAMIEIHIGILVLLGIGVLGGALGAWFFQKIKIPQVVGYIAFGILIGKSGFQLLNAQHFEKLYSFTWFALGLIGFLVGGELKLDTFRKYGKQFVQILIWEGILAFLFVSVSTFAVIYFLTHNLAAGLAAGVVFGAIASATDPASTVEVLWEYRSRGVLTTTIIAIVALDDALAMTLYGIGTSFAEMLIGNGTSMAGHMLGIAIELGGSIVFGLAAGAIMVLFMRYLHKKNERMLAIAIGMLLLIIGLSNTLKLDVILVTMSMGFIIVNLTPHRSEELVAVVRSFSGPIYVMFFVLVGARLGINNMPLWLWAIVILYVLGRSGGKILGCYIGARISGAAPVVQKYSGMGILAQGGVAIGLSIMASEHMGDVFVTETLSLGELIISGVTATTFIVQIIGPAMAKLSIKLAKENDRNITDEDIMEQVKVSETAVIPIESFQLTDKVSQVVKRFSQGEYLAYPVVDKAGKLAGLLAFDQIKSIVLDSDSWDWLLVADVYDSDIEGISLNDNISQAWHKIQDTGVEPLPVLNDDLTPAGLIDSRMIKKKIEVESLNLMANV